MGKLCVQLQGSVTEYEFCQEDYRLLQVEFWSKFYACCLQYQEVLSTPLALHVSPSTAMICVLKKVTLLQDSELYGSDFFMVVFMLWLLTYLFFLLFPRALCLSCCPALLWTTCTCPPTNTCFLKRRLLLLRVRGL